MSAPFLGIPLNALGSKVTKDLQLQSFLNPSFSVCFAFSVVARPESLLVKVDRGALTLERSSQPKVDFSLEASAEVWAKYFVSKPELGYQSFWALFKPQNQLIPASAQVLGDQLKFAQYAPVWRRVLEIVHGIAVPISVAEPDPEVDEEDHITGRYAILELPKWGGKCKIYYEQSGTGTQDILFLHTAGSDGRQYHGVMNDQRLLAKDLRMTVVDLPSHGRSFPPYNSLPGAHFNSEDRYIEFISAVIRHLKLNKTIVCGASMAGLICVAVALRNAEVGAFATIPVQGCEFVDMKRMTWDKHPEVNSTLLVPEFTYGMMSPTTPLWNKNLVWHIYSAQAFGLYAGDLDFYFGGFDYRGKLDSIDTSQIPVAMLSGQYDWSCRPEMSIATAAKIKGAWIKIMEGLGHFPATENPRKFTTYLLEAIDHVNAASSAS
ncbi:Alpha/Beta hydrolase protein [Papiliotrema laurentii]|uniref:Alpha/Beta hydrolase protein n=1 Tax=Papiliotrema laurentii TaxID=5418 RepID=A0AAD9D0J2_PAPLA|nr:Alpha/Beta hydrolase protein [Papiliotrema laurentii]